MATDVRARLYVAPSVQGVLLRRVVIYWLAALLGTAFCSFVWFQLLEQNERGTSLWMYLAPVCITLLVLLPIAVIDTLKLSHRFAGPITRLRSQMRRVAEGEEIPPLHFREGDFWPQMAEEFSAVAARVADLEYQATRRSDANPLAARNRLDMDPRSN